MFNKQTNSRFLTGRVFLDTILLLGIFVAPLWLVFLGAIVCLFRFENFYEIVLIGVIIDSVYGLPTSFFSVPIIYTLFASTLFIIRQVLKKHLVF